MLRWSRLLGATVTVLVTTLDDSVWLIPFIVRDHGCLHAAVFVTTLVGLAVLCCLVAAGIATGLGWLNDQEEQQLEFDLKMSAVILCWTLALGFFLKKQCKKRRRRLQQEQQPKKTNVAGESDPLLATALPSSSSNQMSTDKEVPVGDDEGDTRDSGSQQPSTRAPQPFAVVSLTTFGFLDEISYFPALLLGDVFSVWELCLGTFLAGLCMVGLTLLAAQIRPVVDCLDRIPLYAIIAGFATLLTVQLVWDPLDLDDVAT